MRISAHGLVIDSPAGWDARIRKLDESLPTGQPAASAPIAGPVGPLTGQSAPPAPTAATVVPPPFSVYPVLHTADFSLPEQRGDFGSGAVEIMGPTHAFIALIEYPPASVGTALFANAGMPRQVSADGFSPQQLQRTLRGQAGWQRFFVEKGRAFCLYVVLGGYAQRAAIVPRLNATLARIEVEAP